MGAVRSLSSLSPLLLVALLHSQVALADLPGLARSRAERLRPAQEQALQPFWVDLALDYRENRQFLDGKISAVAALGDGVVPLLLEKLQPVAGGGAARNLAANCRRVLEQLDPASFLDALAELIAGKNEVARREAIVLVGHAASPRAVQILADVLAQGIPEERVSVLEGLARLRAASVSKQVAPMLSSADRRLREAVLDYLVLAAPRDVVDTVLQALATESEDRLLPLYIEYLAAAAPEHDAAARALLPLLNRERLARADIRRLVQVLAVIAPRNHEPTVRRMHEFLDGGDLGALGLQASLTLRALGDKTGVKKLQGALTDQLKRPQRRKDASLYELRGNLMFAIEEYRDAGDDYEKALEFSDSTQLRRRVLWQLVRCEAHRRRWSEMLKHLKDLQPSYEELRDLADKDPAVQEGLQQDRLRSFVQGLSRKSG